MRVVRVSLEIGHSQSLVFTDVTGAVGLSGAGAGRQAPGHGDTAALLLQQVSTRGAQSHDLKELQQELGMGVWVNPRKGRPRMDSRARILIPV